MFCIILYFMYIKKDISYKIITWFNLWLIVWCLKSYHQYFSHIMATGQSIEKNGVCDLLNHKLQWTWQRRIPSKSTVEQVWSQSKYHLNSGPLIVIKCLICILRHIGNTPAMKGGCDKMSLLYNIIHYSNLMWVFFSILYSAEHQNVVTLLLS